MGWDAKQLIPGYGLIQWAKDPSWNKFWYYNTLGLLGDAEKNTGQAGSTAYPPYQPPPPPPPANTHGVGELGMTPNQLAMINPRTQVSQALLQQRMRR